MDYIINQIRLCGTMETAPVFSHENHGRRFYSFFLSVERLSGTEDRLRVLADWELLNAADAAWGERVLVTGQIRSFNQLSETGRHLIISVYAETLELTDEAPDNQAILTGIFCREPVYRRTPLGREICDVMLAVNRPYHRTDYLPCIFWGRTAREMARLTVGARITMTGRLQSRDYVKTLPDGQTEQRTAYEISAVTAELTRD
ncbi:MAG: single-stranded DNA-binding protein [Oscillospiraceae bacterium]|nr:single-stranded DNA-binding protein [Oscillospiraceae bacterium]